MRRPRFNEGDGVSFLLLALVFLAVLAIAYFKAMQEAATYNRLTGSDVSAWDALFVELRVEGSIK